MQLKREWSGIYLSNSGDRMLREPFHVYTLIMVHHRYILIVQKDDATVEILQTIS